MEGAVPLILALVFGNLFLIAFILSLGALFPGRLAQTRLVADLMPGRAFTIGLVNALFFTAIALTVSGLADWSGVELLRLPALLVVSALGLGLSFGLAAVALLVGERLRPGAEAVRRAAWGALALSLGSSLPFVGWFALLPYAACLGLGALIISFFYRARPDPAPGDLSA
jgi:hypothetical protein